METKFCKRCKQTKKLSEFYSPKQKKNYCKECGREMCRSYKARNKAKISAYNKEYKKNNKESISVYNKNYNIENRATIQKRHTPYLRERRKTNINYKLSVTLRNRIKKLVKGERKSLDFIGCDLEFFKKWFTYQFKDDMTFKNHGNIWHIEHVIPCKVFDLTNETEKDICFNWTNLQPMHASENWSKGGRINESEVRDHKNTLKKFIELNKGLITDEIYIPKYDIEKYF
jgi:hypothetical protein